MERQDDSQLKKLSETRLYRIADDSHDIRGWTVVDEQGASLGTVNDLLFDVDSDAVRYAIVETPDNQVLVPIGSLGFEDHARRVVALGFTSGRLRGQTAYQANTPLTPALERQHYEEAVPGVQTDLPLDYSASPFRKLSRTEQIDEQLRLDRQQAPGLQRELSFAGSEPTAEDIAERERRLQEQPPDHADLAPRGEHDFGLDRPK